MLHYTDARHTFPVMDTKERFMRLIDEIKREEYQRGWNDAVENLVAAARMGITAPDHPPDAVPMPPTQEDGTSVIDMVQSVIQDKPGRRGVIILKEVANRMGAEFKVIDRTGRTSLSRLKKRGKIVQRGNKWYPAEEKKSLGPVVGSLAP